MAYSDCRPIKGTIVLKENRYTMCAVIIIYRQYKQVTLLIRCSTVVTHRIQKWISMRPTHMMCGLLHVCH